MKVRKQGFQRLPPSNRKFIPRSKKEVEEIRDMIRPHTYYEEEEMETMINSSARMEPNETVYWHKLSEQDKVRMIITNLLHWPCFESSDGMIERRDGEYLVTFWNDQSNPEHWCVIDRDQAIKAFDPLHHLDDAWVVAMQLPANIKIEKNYGSTEEICVTLTHPDDAYNCVYGFSNNVAEAICMAAFRYLGFPVEDVKIEEQHAES
jgi:hypothetical protein